MIKYGKEDHLKQIVNGLIRFAPSQIYIQMEEVLNIKGQGDRLNGKMKVKVLNAKLYNTETSERKKIPNCTLTMAFQNVGDIPIFCISHYGSEDTKKFLNIKSYTILLSPIKLETIKKDFTEATHALIILEPEKFIAGVQNIKGHQIISDEVNYFNYDVNLLQMYMFLSSSSTEIMDTKTLSLNYNDRHRLLLCKDLAFAYQQEYRFIILEELIEEPVFYNFNFASDYILLPVDELRREIEVFI